MGARTEKVNLPPIKMDSVSVPERSKYGTIGYTQKTHTDLRADPMYQRESEKFLTWLGENQGAYEKITGGLVSSDMFETLRDEEGRLGTAVDRARIMRDAPKDIQETYKYLSEEFVASKAGGFGEILKATWDRGVDMIADPINLTFAFVAPGIGNAATKASTAAAQKVLTSSAGKAAANKTIRNVAAANTGKAAAFEGGAWTGIENYYRQDKNISLGIQDTFSKGDFALSTGAGVVLGGGIGYGLSKAFGPTRGLIDNVNDSSKVVPKRKISFDDPETPKPTKIEHRKFTPRTKDAPATETVETTTINWGPVLDNGKPRVRPDGTPVFATSRKDKDGNFLSIDIDDVAIREAFDSKPWTTSKVKGVTPLKENDIQSPEEWIMFNLFHERNHASFSKGNTPTAIYENGANIAALKDLKIWRETQEIEELVPFTAGVANFNKTQSKINATLSATFDKVNLDTNKITGASFYNRLLNPEVDNSLLNKLTRGTKKGADSAIIMLPEADAANLILAFKDIVIKAGADGDSELTLNVIAPKIKEAIRGYGFNDEQLTYLVKEVGEAYGPPPKTRPSSVNIDEDELIYARLSEKNMLDLSNQLANDVGGSSRNTGSMLFDEVANINADGSLTPLQVKNSIASRVLASTQKYLSTSIGGFLKAPNILAPAKRFAPNTIAALQKLFSSEIGQSWRTGSVALRGDDFGTYANQRFGTWHTTWRTAYDGIKTTTRGKQREEIDTLISDAVRKNSMTGLSNVKFATPEAKQAVVDSIKVLQTQLREIGKEGEAKGLLQNLAGNYLPRLWLRDNIVANKDKFVDLVISPRGVKGFTTREEGTAFVNELLEIKNQFGNEFGGAGNSFFSNRKIEVVDETLFNDFLDTDLDRIMTGYFSSASKTIAKKDILGVRNLEEFNQIWLPAIEKEMKLNGADGADILQAKKNASYLYRNITGESMERYGPRTQNAIELYMLANRLALLPLSTLSSLTEIFINMSKAGVGTSMRGFRDAAMGGSKRMYDDSMDVLMKTHKMSRAEARKELNELGIALDQAASDSIERLSGDQLSNATMRKISNGFFKLTLLEQWTKTVQLSSYIVGKRLITENIENLASKTALINKGQISKRMQRQIDELADFGIDYKDGIKWYDAGAKLDDAFYAKVKKGGGIYTNEVILNPSSQSGLKPTFMSNPKTSVFGQLLGYPAAFTNTVLKGMIKQTVRDPQTFFTQHVPAAAMMTGIAAFTNGVRSDGKSWEDKEGFEIAIDGIIRWGGNGVLADMVKRGSESAQYYQEPLAYFTGAGVVAGDAYNLVRQGDLFTFLGGKIPGTGAINAILGPFESTENFAEDFRDFTQDLDRSMADFVVRDREAKGGVVDDVAQVTEEPDERIDRMTGLPYNLQAGGAFIDEEDRQEFVKGSKT